MHLCRKKGKKKVKMNRMKCLHGDDSVKFRCNFIEYQCQGSQSSYGVVVVWCPIGIEKRAVEKEVHCSFGTLETAAKVMFISSDVMRETDSKIVRILIWICSYGLLMNRIYAFLMLMKIL